MHVALVIQTKETDDPQGSRSAFWDEVTSRQEAQWTLTRVGAEDAVAQAITLIPTLRPKVVFAHWSDTIRVNDRLTSNCGAVGAALIQYTGTPGSPKIEGTKVVGLPYDTLKENIDSFLLHAGASDRITEEELLLLVAIDPKLERLLAPFSATSPFKAPSIPQAKENLKAYIAKKLGEPES